MNAIAADLDLNSDLDRGLGDGAISVAPPLTLPLNNGSGVFVDGPPPRAPFALVAAFVFAGDFDGDEDPDILTGTWLGPGGTVLSNLSRHAYPPAPPRLGQTFQVDLYGRAGTDLYLGLSPRYRAATVPPFGTFVLDPATSAFAPPVHFATTGQQAFTLPVPNDPQLVGVSVYGQAVDVDLSNMMSSRVTNWFVTTVR